MSSINKKLSLFSAAFIFFSFANVEKAAPNIVEGVIVTGKPATPVSRAHVYVIDGEEEALTNDKGEFKITTWKEAPLTLTVEHSQYETQKIKVTSFSQRQQVVLKKK